MEAQVQLQQMVVHTAGYSADGLLGNACEYGIPDFLENGSADACHTICSLQRLLYDVLGAALQATIMDPATVQAVPPTEMKSIFIESTMLLK